MPGGLKFDFAFGSAPRSARREEETPLRLLVMADFSGRGRRADPGGDLSQRSVVRVDLDNFDQVLGRFAPKLQREGTAIEFGKLDDFHPDRLFQRLPLFQALRDTRARLKNPATFAAAAAELRQHAAPSEETPPPFDDTAETIRREALKPSDDDAATLNRLLGQKTLATPASTAQPSPMQSLIKTVVAPYIVSDQTPFQDQYLAAVDTAATELMRRLLHHEEFQPLEAAWRGIRLLVDTLDLDEAVRLELVDITQEELRADIGRCAGALENSGLYRLLVSRGGGAPDTVPWSLLVGLYTFGGDDADVTLLASLGAIAAQIGAPFLAGASASVLGCRSLVDTPEPADWKQIGSDAVARWQALRASPAAKWIGLALPRVLLRLPFGKATDAVEQFAFEELTSEREHKHYLWGNPALACALLMGQSFMEQHWEMEPGNDLELDLPAVAYEHDGEKRLQACAEAFLGDRAGQAILERGLMPLLSFRNRNAARLLRFQSIAAPAAPLAGPWA